MITQLNKQAEALTGDFNFTKSEFVHTATNCKKFHYLTLCYKVKYIDPSFLNWPYMYKNELPVTFEYLVVCL